MSVVLEGGCLCGSVRFNAIDAPLCTFACHRTFCQRMTGSTAGHWSLSDVRRRNFLAPCAGILSLVAA